MLDRYTLPEMENLWSDEYKFEKMLEVELAICYAWNKLGKIKSSDLEKIEKGAKVDLPDIRKREEKSRHETIAFVESVASHIGSSGKYLHYGVTSSDVLDTAQALQIRDSLIILLSDTEKFSRVLIRKAKKYKYQQMVGRTHGMHAEPTTLGLKFLIWVYELERVVKRLENSIETISYGKISGSVGTYSQIDPKVEALVCKKLKLKRSKVSSQIIQRDRYCDVIYAVTTLGNTLEKIATEIRHLHRTEINEIKEPFIEGQKGSSSMPHKKNPILCERICGLSRILRGNLSICMENTNLWHERDMSHSSAERIIIPDSLCLVHFMLSDISSVICNLVVNKVQMRENLQKEKGNIFSQSLMLLLISKGMEKKEAYELVQDISFNNTESFEQELHSNTALKDLLTDKDIESITNLSSYTRHVDYIFDNFNNK